MRLPMLRVGFRALASVFICLILTAHVAEARQAPSAVGPFGIHGGVGAAIFADAGPTVSWTPTFMIGMFYTPPRVFATWQIEGLFQTKGSKLTSGNGATVSSGYFEAAGFLRINVMAERRTRVHFLLGSSAGWKAAASLQSGGQTTDLGSLGRGYDVSLVAAAGVEINMLTFEFRWSEGLTTTGLHVDDRDTRNRVLTGLVGFRFGR